MRQPYGSGHLRMDWGLKDGETSMRGGWNPEDYDQLILAKPIANAPGQRCGF